MTEHKTYDVCAAASRAELIEMVQAKERDGWKAKGSICVVLDPANEKLLWAQAMSRK